MSDARLVVALMAAALTFDAASLRGQTSTPAIDSLLRRVHTLDSSLIVRSRALDSVRRSLIRAVPPVDVRRGAMQVRTTADLEPRVRTAVDSVAVLIERRGGASLAARVATHVPLVARDSTRSIFGAVPVLSFASDTSGRWPSTTHRPIPASATSAEVADALAGMVEQFALQGVDSAFGAWIMVGRVPLRPARPSEGADAYIEIMTAESAALRRCQSGDKESCLDVLGVDSLPGARLARWYAPQDYRTLLRAVAPAREDSAAVAAWVRCREDRDEPACVVAATSLANDRVPTPLSATARVTFLREVLEAGGANAYERLVTTDGSVRTRLTEAAGMPLDTVVGRWRARISESRPERMRLRPGLVVASLGWTGALLGLALIRRGPWA